jgi:hypothetical protein
MGKAVWGLAVALCLAGYFFFNNPLSRIAKALPSDRPSAEPKTVYTATDMDRLPHWVETPATVVHDFKADPAKARKFYTDRRHRIVGHVRAVKTVLNDVHVILDVDAERTQELIMVFARDAAGLSGIKPDEIVILDGTGDGLALDIPIFRSSAVKAVGFTDFQPAWDKAAKLD